MPASAASSGAIPIDQKYQPRSQEFEVLGPLFRRFSRVSSDTHVVQILGQFLRSPGPGVFPIDGEMFEHVLKEDQTLHMHIRVSHNDLCRSDMNHNDMRIRCANIILNDKFAWRSRGGRIQAGMLKLQFARAIDTAHESRNQLTIGSGHAIDTGTVDRLGSDLSLQAIEFLVQVHHQQMQAVSACRLSCRDGIDFRSRYQLGIEPRGNPGREMCQTPLVFLAVFTPRIDGSFRRLNRQ